MTKKSAGGGKTILGCFWILSSALAYPETRWLIGRKNLTVLKRTTLNTFFELLKTFGLKPDDHYTFNAQESCFKFRNGSQVLLLDLDYFPSDPMFTRLGSLELTGAFVDEANEVRFTALDILATRVGRKNNQKYNLKPKILETFNPDHGHVYSRFFKPFRDKTMPEHRVFIQALATDNKYINPEYIKQLEKADKITRERLLYGNFDFDDDQALLLDYDDIQNLFTNPVLPTDEKFISVDVARMGNDKTIAWVWNGFVAKIGLERQKSLCDDTVKALEALALQEGVKRSNIIIDEDGLGSGIVDFMKGCKGFLNGSSPIQPREAERDLTRRVNYANLKTQCAFEFAAFAKAGKIKIESISGTAKEYLCEELAVFKQKDADKDGKIALIGKDLMKEKLGRSPDYADALIMRMYFHLKKPVNVQPLFY